jgi:hypothetical protein
VRSRVCNVILFAFNEWRSNKDFILHPRRPRGRNIRRYSYHCPLGADWRMRNPSYSLHRRTLPHL